LPLDAIFFAFADAISIRLRHDYSLPLFSFIYADDTPPICIRLMLHYCYCWPFSIFSLSLFHFEFRRHAIFCQFSFHFSISRLRFRHFTPLPIAAIADATLLSPPFLLPSGFRCFCFHFDAAAADYADAATDIATLLHADYAFCQR
jgi:hypothetical protein